MKLSEENKHFLANDENFIALVQVLKEDYKVRSKIESLLSLNKFNRKSALNTWLGELKFQQAPEKFIALLSCLLDDDIAKNLLRVIKE